jgi:hypothetical protein
MSFVKRPTRLLVLICGLVLGACLWRPPIVPPLATGRDGGVPESPDARSGGFQDASNMTPPTDTPTPDNNGEAFASCDDYSNRTDGAAPPDGMVRLHDGSIAQCPASDSDGGRADSAADGSATRFDGAMGATDGGQAGD